MYGSNWQNEAGEPYMTAAALRFEAELDMQAAEERFMDSLDDESYWGGCPPEDEDECEECGEPNQPGEHDRCCSRNEPYDNSDEYFMEDQWLDGSYEE